jgi:hypothetical protein
MPNNEDYVQDDYVEEGQDSDYSQESEQQDDPVTSQIKQLQSQIQGLQASLHAKSKPAKQESQELELSDDQYAAIAKDPKLMGQFMKAHIQKTTSTIKAEQQKAHYDKVAEEKFPALKTNQELRNAVSTKMNELVENGEYSWASPTLLLRATEMVVPTVRGVLDVNRRRGEQGEALDATTTTVHRRNPLKSKVQDNDPRVQFAKAFGINDPKKLEAFKSKLEPYVEDHGWKRYEICYS